MPVTVVPTSFATVAIDTFITELSSVIRNCALASVSRTMPAPFATSVAAPLVPDHACLGDVDSPEALARYQRSLNVAAGEAAWAAQDAGA